jgi:hypothetical protein
MSDENLDREARWMTLYLELRAQMWRRRRRAETMWFYALVVAFIVGGTQGVFWHWPC